MTSERPKEPHGGFGERRKPQPPGDTEPKHPTEQRLNHRIPEGVAPGFKPEGVAPRDSKKEGD